MRRALGASLALTSLLLIGGASTAHAQSETESFVGCPLLLEGQSSECVRVLQGYLNLDNDGYRLEEDGTFGPATRVAVLDYQGRNGLPADGNVGGATADAILDRVEEVRRDMERNSVASPRPGRPLGNGAATAMGKPAGQCLAEAVGIDEMTKDAIEKNVTGEIDKQPDGAKGSFLNKVKWVSKGVGKFSGPKQAFDMVKCIMWDMPES